MYLTNLFCERFAERSNLRVDGLVDGLNIVFGPPGFGKTTVVRFLQAMFGGFDVALRERHLSCGWGGKMSLQTDQHSYSISRYDDGGRDGRLTVERADEAACDGRQVHRLLNDLNHALLSHAVVVDFNRRPELHELLSEIAACGFLPTLDSQQNEQKRVRDAEVLEAEQHLALLRREIANVERTLSELGHRRQQLTSQLHALRGQRPRTTNDANELRLVERQLRRWKRTLRDLLHYKKISAETYAARNLVHPSTSQAATESPDSLVAYEHLSSHLRNILDHLGAQDGSPQAITSIRSQVSGALDNLQHDVRRANGLIDRERARQDARDLAAQQEQFARSEAELRRAIRWLMWRRARLLATRSTLEVSPFDIHGRTNSVAELSATETALAGDLQSLNQEIDRLAEVRLKWLAEVDEWEIDLADRRAKLNQTSDSWVPLVRDATEFLRRLTGNDQLHIHIAGNCDAWLENQAGQRLRYDQVDRGTRDQLYLAFCLAVALANQRWGRKIPLIFNGVFTHFPAQNIRHALEFLADFGHGQQIICLTRHEHVVSVARLMNIPVRALYVQEPALAAVPRREDSWMTRPEHFSPVANRSRIPSMENAVRTIEEQSRRAKTISPHATIHANDQVPASTVRPASARQRHVEVPDVTSTSGDGTYCLIESDPIEKAPSLDAVNAQRLRKIGLLRVGDLLRVPTADVAHDLRHTGVTIDMIESWRAQARLMCRVPGLRNYDARILVACGIRDADQLLQMQPGALRARVKEFASSAEGQAILMSGTEFELSRVTDWISTARELQRPEQSTASRAAGENRQASERTQRRRERRTVADNTASQSHARGKRARKANVVQLTNAPHAHQCLLQMTDSIGAIPWLGKVSIKRLQKAGIHSVAALVEAAADTVVAQLKLSRVRRETVLRWQAQLQLLCAVPNLSVADSRVLYVLGVTSTELLAVYVPSELWQKVSAYCQSEEGERLLGNRNSPPPQEQVAGWIASARQRHPVRAA